MYGDFDNNKQHNGKMSKSGSPFPVNVSPTASYGGHKEIEHFSIQIDVLLKPPVLQKQGIKVSVLVSNCF